jgi:hypothetical protein
LPAAVRRLLIWAATKGVQAEPSTTSINAAPAVPIRRRVREAETGNRRRAMSSTENFLRTASPGRFDVVVSRSIQPTRDRRRQTAIRKRTAVAFRFFLTWFFIGS